MDLSREEIIEQAAQVVQSGRLALLTSSEPDSLSMLLGDIAVSMMDFGADVIRIDALEHNTATHLVAALCDYLGVPGKDLLAGLRIRGETGNPVCLVIDNSECLEGKSLDALHKLIEGTACGVGILLGGEPELHQYLRDAGIAASLHMDVTSAETVDSDSAQDEGSAGLLAVLPWKHLAAVLGLVILIWLFWPADDSADEAVQPLALPVPEKAVPTPQEASEPPTRPDSGEPASAARESIRTPVVEPEPAPEPKPAPAPAPAKPVTQAKPEPAPAPAPRPAPVKPLTGLAAQLGYQQEEWLLTQSPGQWMLQVALAATEDNARQLLDQIGRKQSAYYRAARNGKTVYVVLAGPWRDRAAAVSGKASLPAALQKLGPFPRELAAIHQEIGAR